MTRVLPLLMALLLAACSKSTPAAAKTQSTPDATQAVSAQQEEPSAKPVPAVLPDVVARVNGETIGKDEFERSVREVELRAGGSVPPDQRDRVLRGVLDEMIAYRLLAQESRARGIAVTDAEIEERIDAIRRQFPSEQVFEQTLEQRSMTLDTLRTNTRQGMQIDKLLDAEMAGKVTVKPEEVADFYQKNPDEFRQGERVRASHILIGMPQNSDAATKEKARAAAARVLEEVKAGKDFAALAKEHSQDPGSAANGGDLGYFERGQMVGPFEQAAFSVPAGQTSDLVETPFGFHIIKVIDKQPARTVALDEVRPQIEKFLESQNREQQMRAFVDGLRTKGKVEILI